MRGGRDGWFWVLAIAGLANVGNGLWMLADPKLWYTDLPAAVPDFGPYNEHFVRDIGGAFLAFGAALVWAAVRPAFRLPLVGVTALFFAFHAAFHVYDTARGFVDAEHWWIDLPGVYLPALVFAAFVWLLARPRTPASRLERSRP
jgi:hypothetical protein